MLDFLQNLLANGNQNPMASGLPSAQPGQLPTYLMNPLNSNVLANPAATSLLPTSMDNNAILSNLRQQILAQSLKGMPQSQSQQQPAMNMPPMPTMGMMQNHGNMLAQHPGFSMQPQAGMAPAVQMPILRRFLGQGGY